jgi:DNA-binding NarL/FixJ family response regulator
MIRLLLADDHAVLRTGMRRLLSDVADLEVVLEVGSGFDAIDAVRTYEVDVAILDVTMPGPDVVTTIESIRSASPRTHVVVLSTHPPEQYAIRVLRAGASAYVMKQEPWTEVVAAIRKAHAGGRYITAALAEVLADSFGRGPKAKAELSDREMQVLEKISAGLSPAEIALQLNVSPKSVHTYRARLLEKLELRSTADLIRYALEHHFTE